MKYSVEQKEILENQRLKYKIPDLVLYNFYVLQDKMKDDFQHESTDSQNTNTSISDLNIDKENYIAYVYRKPFTESSKKIFTSGNFDISQYIKEQQQLVYHTFQQCSIYIGDVFTLEDDKKSFVISLFKELCKNTRTEVMGSKKEFKYSLYSLKRLVDERIFNEIISILRCKYFTNLNNVNQNRNNSRTSFMNRQKKNLSLTEILCNEYLMKSYIVSISFEFMFKDVVLTSLTSCELQRQNTNDISHIIKLNISQSCPNTIL